MQLTEQHRQLSETVVNFVRSEINPHVAKWEAKESLPAHEVFKKMGGLGLLGVKYEEKYGGLGLDFTYALTMAEALGECDCGGVPLAIGVQDRHVHACACPLRQRRVEGAVPCTGDRRRYGWLPRRQRASVLKYLTPLSPQ